MCFSTGESVLDSRALESMSTNIALMMLVITICVTACLAYLAFERVTRPPYVENGVFGNAISKGLVRMGSLNSLTKRANANAAAAAAATAEQERVLKEKRGRNASKV